MKLEIINFNGVERPATYLGDGVYAIHNGYGIWLHANDHRIGFATNRIYLEPGVLSGLNSFAEQTAQFAEKEDERKESENLANTNNKQEG